MAVKPDDESLYHTTNDLILPRPLKFYCAPMQSGHQQLRSLISSPRPNILFYPNGKDIVVLNTETRESYLLTTLKFEPRCLTSTSEWLCCGGGSGEYTAIYFGDESRSGSYLGQDIEADARLPFDLDPYWRSIPVQRSSKDIRSLTEVSKAVGNNIVNCIAIWTPSNISSKRTYQGSVAIVSSNDRSISILKLDNAELLEKLTLPDCVNRSLMSPEGDMLISICDDPFLYIHRRKDHCKINRDLFSSSEGQNQWYLEGRVQIEAKVQLSASKLRGSFAAAFSPSGKYLAVATEYGIISVFDKENVFAPPVSVFTASRIDSSGEGHIRDMEFCPGPFDLLAWTESKGRIGIADVRNLFISRQVLFLDPNQLKDVIKISINDRTSVSSAGSRSLTSDSIYRVLPDPSSLDSEISSRRPSRTLSRDELSILSHRRAQLRLLDPNFTRQQREGSVTRVETAPTPTWRSSIEVRRPISISYTTSSLRSGRSSNAITLGEFLSQERAPSFRSFINDRNREQERRIQQEYEQDSQPRRPSAPLFTSSLTGTDSLAERDTIRNEGDTNVNLERLSLSTSQRRDNDPEGPWMGTSSLQQRPSTHQNSSNRLSRLRIELEDDDRGEIETRMDELIDFALDAQHVISAQRNRAQYGVYLTMGCCWSQDGKVIYTATEDGIHEFHVNVRGRKFFPRLALC